MIPNIIRTIAVGIIRRGNSILVIEWYDSVKKEQFYRPIGGGVDFQEKGEDAVIREFREEIGAELEQVSFLGVMENIFTYEGTPGHEIVLIFNATFADRQFYEMEIINGIEEGNSFLAKWKELDDFRSGKSILYPDGLLQLLEGQSTF
jgi:ADP-ribose pyrophosphatase YjhB (NUDIX family)